MLLLSFEDIKPRIHPSVFLAKGVVVSGDVEIGEDSSIWYNTVIRGDIAPTVIGRRVSVQDNSTLHQSPNNPLILEDEVTVGHNAVLHSCIVRRGALIGMGSIIMDRAEIGEDAMVAAGALVPPGMKVPPRSLVVGNPAKVKRELNEADYKELVRIRQSYVDKGKTYRQLEQTPLERE
ncbi:MULTISPECIES: gamma carbonic anhydrase [Brevibacillus]|jgi:carbonic anhydrase/acetyltransferase-like protein (isoleucine patch superfamily)|uniref:Carbonic anhydrase or acetyltransferase, isoleucine patch superfamily n=1 Tax=Brevibacillus centrosporus TaxID=54910 RepID=A0A1I3TUX5_9BACL|nr:MULTISPECIES: gamma carbonic anhydrase family protein [Brevibacillus]MDR7317708.1 carbonic anhydrase/acetyltransferase-like protein (isoleucine patch superfamily) [Brevibacillus nitrificans]MEC2132491.1 gamma carbonic anhydrase family protein [Brevibacillus centrosporus]MED1950592.1 gamma carbonic anhydrase family protein [Brevibacillus centrosporus]RNB69756.1 gamma carbonic anhydrase family protein [Brevibacillus centrosporus]SFJ74129.1 Carbonic anhydrase or acetyltransferase, isoleucine p